MSFFLGPFGMFHASDDVAAMTSLQSVSDLAIYRTSERCEVGA